MPNFTEFPIPRINIADFVTDAEDARDAAILAQTGAETAETNAQGHEAGALAAKTAAELAALAAGAPIVTSLTDPTPSDGTIELLKLDAGLQVWEVQSSTWTLLGWLVGPTFDTVADLLASTATSLGPTGQIVYGADIRFQVVTTGETDTTVGGVKLERLDALGFINTKERKPILGNRDIASPIGEVNFGSDRSLDFADGASRAGTYHAHRMELDGVNDYQLLAGTYLASLNVVNNGSGWQDAATLYIQGQPNDPADQDGSTSFALFINSGFSRIRDRVVIGNYDFSQDVLTVNGGSGTDYTLTVRNEGVAQPYMFRIIEPVKSGTTDPADAGFPMMRLQPSDGVGSYLEVRTGGEILTTQFGDGAWTDASQGTDTEYFLGVDTNGKWRETSAAVINNFGIGEVVAHEGTISVAGGKKVVFLNGTASPSTYTLPSGSDGQHLILKAVATGAQTHTVSGSFMRDPEDFPNVNQASISMLGFESVDLVFRAQGTNRWEVVGRTKR